MEKEVQIKLDKLEVRVEERILLHDISWQIAAGQAWAVVGHSGSGKTLLGKVLAGYFAVPKEQLEFFLPSHYRRVFVSQQHDFRYMTGTRSYYQQRFDRNYGNDFPVVRDVFAKILKTEVLPGNTTFEEIVSQLHIESILDRSLIELSNGEGKRVQLATALLQKPQILILDNPFIGLDKNSRVILHTLINQLVEEGMLVVLLTQPDEIPSGITDVLELRQGTIHRSYTRAEYIGHTPATPIEAVTPKVNSELLQHLRLEEDTSFAVAIRMHQANVRYGEKTVLENISWEVKRGEKWALSGPNGSGKSTLLSLINADNPQAYTNDIYLFDQKRGSGESIWDIKRKIGYISPELHIYFQRNTSYIEAVEISSTGTALGQGFSKSSVSAFEAVCSGFHDQVGSSERLGSWQLKTAEQWMEVLNIAYLKKYPLDELSLGEQRLVLLARALVKNPALLILDEPCQGLDPEQTRHFVAVVDEVCRYSNKTLLYVSHYPEDIPQCVDHFIELEDGRIKVLSSKS
jgi:molybdate transport system ATP-binding protein